MTEHDVFESRLHAALVRHVANGPTEFDALAFARTVAAKEPRRHGCAAALQWRGNPIPRVAWVLLLLAALLTAMVAGMLVAGSQPVRQLPAVVPPVGQTFACPAGTDPDKPGPADQARPRQDPYLAIAFDRRAGRIVMLSGVDQGVKTWTFDVCTNTWMQMHPNQEPFGWVRLVYDVGSDRTIGVADCRNCDVDPTGTVWSYNLEANTWNRMGAAPTGVTDLFYNAAAGLVVAARSDGNPDAPRSELSTYDVKTGTWTPIVRANTPSRTVFTYDASVDRIVAYGPTEVDPQSADHETRVFDIRTGGWLRSRAVTPGIWGPNPYWGTPPAIAYDEAAQRTVVFGGILAAYDAAADRWEVLIDNRDPSVWLPASLVYDPANRRLVGLGRGVIVQGGVVAFDTRTREWTVLLEPGNGQPAP